MTQSARNFGIRAALTSAVFLGIAPIFGKQAILFGFTPLAVVTFRTLIATLFLFILMLLFKRQFFYIYPLGLAGCILAGLINGLGSILYYSALSRLDASIGHLLYSFYPLFLALWLLLDHQRIHSITIFRLVLAVPGIFLLVNYGSKEVDLLGAGLMFGSGLLYALHLLINQRVLYEVPAPTVTFYTLAAMSITVSIAFACFDLQMPSLAVPWWPIFGMAFFTFFSRLALFLGVKHLGGMQTALLGLGELLVAVVLAHIWLGDRLTIPQWVGTGLLVACLLLLGVDKYYPERRQTSGLLAWLKPPKISPGDIPWQPHP
jgi:drug/metabolite transporter (DMT)-like permease